MSVMNLRTQLDNIDIKEARWLSSKSWREIWTQKRKLGKKIFAARKQRTDALGGGQ